MSNKKSVLFVCLGNICRSPAAEGICKHIAKSIHCDSAALGSWEVGDPPDQGSVKACRKHGIDITSHRARQISKQDFYNFDVIACLDADVFRSLKDEKPKDSSSRLVLFNDPKGIFNPWGYPQKVFDEVFDEMYKLMPQFLKDNDLV